RWEQASADYSWLVELGLGDSMYICFFFFQAEDGIRDYKVTGVQTCALPICRPRPLVIVPRATHKVEQQIRAETLAARGLARWVRSEERRVGKECRSGWSRCHKKKKKKKKWKDGER